MTSREDLQQRVALLVAQVILETSGRFVEPAPDDDLFEKRWLESIDLAHLILRLQSEFDVVLDLGEANPRALRSVSAITDLLVARAAG